MDVKPKTSLKVGFIGGSHLSAVGRVHRIAIETDQRMQLVAGCFSRDEKVSKHTADEYRIDSTRAYFNVSKFLIKEQSNLDAVIILTPQDQHLNHILQVIEAGVPIICEKTLVEKSEDALIIQRKNQGFISVISNYTGYPMVRELRHMISSGGIGDVQQVFIEMPQEGYTRKLPTGAPMMPQKWRLSDGYVPTISFDLGSHIHMLVSFLTGAKPIELVAIQRSRGNFPEVIDSVHCIARYSSNIDVNISYGKTMLGYRNGLRIRVFGNQGAIEWLQENPEVLSCADNKGLRYCIDRTSEKSAVACQPRYQRFKAGHPAGFIEAFANYYYDVADALEHFGSCREYSKNPYVFGLEESLEGLRMLEGIARSSRSKAWEVV